MSGGGMAEVLDPPGRRMSRTQTQQDADRQAVVEPRPDACLGKCRQVAGTVDKQPLVCERTDLSKPAEPVSSFPCGKTPRFLPGRRGGEAGASAGDGDPCSGLAWSPDMRVPIRSRWRFHPGSRAGRSTRRRCKPASGRRPVPQSLRSRRALQPRDRASRHARSRTAPSRSGVGSQTDTGSSRSGVRLRRPSRTAHAFCLVTRSCRCATINPSASSCRSLWMIVPMSWAPLAVLDASRQLRRQLRRRIALGPDRLPPGAPVPEPATLLLLGSGLAAAGLRRRRLRGTGWVRRKAKALRTWRR